MQKLSKVWVAGAPLIVALVGLYSFSTHSQVDGYSSTELKKMKVLSKNDMKSSNACAGFEAEFNNPMREKPEALIDIEQFDFIQGTVAKILEVISVNPKTYRFLVKDPNACKNLAEKRREVSVTVSDGKGSDGKPIFPTERSFKLR